MILKIANAGRHAAKNYWHANSRLHASRHAGRHKMPTGMPGQNNPCTYFHARPGEHAALVWHYHNRYVNKIDNDKHCFVIGQRHTDMHFSFSAVNQMPTKMKFHFGRKRQSPVPISQSLVTVRFSFECNIFGPTQLTFLERKRRDWKKKIHFRPKKK